MYTIHITDYNNAGHSLYLNIFWKNKLLLASTFTINGRREKMTKSAKLVRARTGQNKEKPCEKSV